MNKLLFRRVLNLLLWLSICFMAGSGLLLKWKFPHGQGRGSGRLYELLGLDKHEWGQVHTWVGIAFALLVLAHLYLAWPWLKSAAAGRKRLWAVFAGLALGLAIPVGLMLAPVRENTLAAKDSVLTGSPEQSPPEPGYGQGQGPGKGYRWRQQ
ncbi:DUF4405 domain-containing protein [Ruficoccus amylovorans]|uniref:DUF4405 domain-containing protein n=1 Tax=Ruficoccus amylovorans TaxID=1804625 RepID=A0A842HEI1_9BACT|nr:DUF4405 domain-containing protein [Ruficoccus amylovorans]MBC2593731.1 DUF4405 domain-containing protein [Ruficoccus amylovorans]